MWELVGCTGSVGAPWVPRGCRWGETPEITFVRFPTKETFFWGVRLGMSIRWTQYEILVEQVSQ